MECQGAKKWHSARRGEARKCTRPTAGTPGPAGGRTPGPRGGPPRLELRDLLEAESRAQVAVPRALLVAEKVEAELLDLHVAELLLGLLAAEPRALLMAGLLDPHVVERLVEHDRALRCWEELQEDAPPGVVGP